MKKFLQNMTATIPKIQPLASIAYQQPEYYTLDNGIEVFGFNGAGNDILKVDIQFDSGRWAENKPLSASFCAELIKSGFNNKSAFELAENIDFIGSTINASGGYNSFTVHLYCLTRHLEACLKILASVINETIFPESELQLSKDGRLSQFKINQLKNDYVGDMIFKEKLFGKSHPYGYATTAEAINDVSREDLIGYYNTQLAPSICTISIAGKYKQHEVGLLNKYLGNNKQWTKGSNQAIPDWTIETSDDKKHVIELPNSVQASIFIGGLSIGRKHEDYIAYSLLNMIYGGYFGSRLMSNLREDKGLTYGIYSYAQNYRNASAFIINTDSAIEHTNTCLKEIYFEMSRLKDQLVPIEELTMAKNYLLGRLLDQVDGPFKTAGTFMGLKGHGLSLDYLKKMETTIQNIESEKLLNIAQQYFIPEQMFEVVVK